jgi:hypothetical protein
MSEMTPRQRLMTALQGKQPDRVPCCPSVTRWTRYHKGCMCPRHLLQTAEEFGFDPIVQYGAYTCSSMSNDYVYSPGGGYSYAASGLYGDLPDVNVDMHVKNTPEHVWYHRTFHTPAGDLTDVMQWARPDVGYGDGPNPHRVEPLVKSALDLDALKYLYAAPRKDMIADIPLMLEEIGDRGLLVGENCTHAGSWGMEVLGPEGMLMASVEDPGLLKAVCRLAQDAHLRNLRAMLEQGIDVIYDSWFQCGPSVGWSVGNYREFFLPLLTEVVALAHEFDALYMYQDDGRMRDIIPSIVQAGVDAISGLQPPDVGDVVLKDVKHQFGSQVALVGGLDPCYTFDMGKPDDARAAVRQAIVDAGHGGGYVVATGEAVSPDTTPETLRAAAQAARDYGVYGRDL